MIRFRSRLRDANSALVAQVAELQLKLAESRRALASVRDTSMPPDSAAEVDSLRRRLADAENAFAAEQVTTGHLRKKLAEVRHELAGIEFAKVLASYPHDAQQVIETQQRNLIALSNQLADAEGRNKPPVRLGGWNW